MLPLTRKGGRSQLCDLHPSKLGLTVMKGEAIVKSRKSPTQNIMGTIPVAEVKSGAVSSVGRAADS